MASLLFTPVRIGNLTLANRIVIAPMCQYSALDGKVQDWHLMHYGSLSHSGAGLLIVEATAVSPEGRITPWDIGLWSAETEEALHRLVQTIRKYSPMRLSLQLAHAGRKASHDAPWMTNAAIPPEKGGWTPIAPSATPFSEGGTVPEAMNREDCQRVKNAFAEAAERAARIGFDAVELHAAHGYLLHEFLSPLSNKREDDYSGSLDNRMRYPLEVFDAVRKAFPAEKPVGVRISATDRMRGGWDVEHSCCFALELQKRDGAYIHVSSGGLTPTDGYSTGPGYQVGMASKIRAALEVEAIATPMPVIAVGLITEAELAESIVRTGQADLVALGRGILFDPRWPWHAAAKLGARSTLAPQYLRAAPKAVHSFFEKF